MKLTSKDIQKAEEKINKLFILEIFEAYAKEKNSWWNIFKFILPSKFASDYTKKHYQDFREYFLKSKLCIT